MSFQYFSGFSLPSLEILIGIACAINDGLASWCVAVGLLEDEESEETPPTRRTAPFGEGKSLGNRAETERLLRFHDET